MEVAFDIVSSEEARKLGKGVFKVGKHFARLNPVASSVLLAYEIGNYIVEHQPQDIGKIGEITEFAKKVVEKASSASKLKQEIGGKYGSPNFDPNNDWEPDDGRERFKWEIKEPKDADKIVRHGKFGKFYRDPTQKIGNKEVWWTKDNARHGGSEYKIYIKDGEELKHIADLDKHGVQILKYKGNIGKNIPYKEFIGVR